jgi:hypothetical protein
MSREDERFSDRPSDDRGGYHDDRGDRRRDDEYDIRRRAPSGMDGFFLNTNMVILVLFGICCNGIALILGIIGLAVCKDPDAKQRAMIVTIIGGIITVLGIVGRIASLAGGDAMR